MAAANQTPSRTGIGAALPRSEDRRLLTGRGNYAADLVCPDACFAAFVCFLIVLPTTKLRHMVTSPMNMYLKDKDRPKGAMKPMPNLMETELETFGVATIEVMKRSGATCLAIDAQRCLLLDGDAVILAADASQNVTGQVFAVRKDEIFLMSQSRPVRAAHKDGGWTPETIRDWISTGKIVGKKINNLWRVPSSEIRRLINEG